MFKIAYVSNPGKVRKNNEDSVLVDEKLLFEANMPKPEYIIIEKETAVFAVADGMGGHQCGEAASRATLEVFNENIEQIKDIRDIQVLIKMSKNILNQMAADDPKIYGLGTTVTGLLLKHQDAYIFNCGDSRVYKINPNAHQEQIKKITKDHSLVQEMVDNGLITEDEMLTHPRKNIITSAIIGDLKKENPEIFLQEMTLKLGEKFLICSDGVWESISRPELEECFDRETIKESAESLFSKVMASNARDNLSFIIFEYC